MNKDSQASHTLSIEEHIIMDEHIMVVEHIIVLQHIIVVETTFFIFFFINLKHLSVMNYYI